MAVPKAELKARACEAIDKNREKIIALAGMLFMRRVRLPGGF